MALEEIDRTAYETKTEIFKALMEELCNASTQSGTTWACSNISHKVTQTTNQERNLYSKFQKEEVNMKCTRCHQTLTDGKDPIRLTLHMRIGMFLGFIPKEWHCMKCKEEQDIWKNL